MLIRWIGFSTEHEVFCQTFFNAEYAPPKYVEMRFAQRWMAAGMLLGQVDVAPLGSRAQRLDAAALARASSNTSGIAGWAGAMLPTQSEADVPFALLALGEKFSSLRELAAGDPEKLVNRMVAARNHMLGRPESSAVWGTRGASLYYLYEKLGVFVRGELLLGLGFSVEEVDRMFARNREPQFLRRKDEPHTRAHSEVRSRRFGTAVLGCSTAPPENGGTLALPGTVTTVPESRREAADAAARTARRTCG